MPEQIATPTSLRALFEPASVAVVGASPTNFASRAALENFALLGFEGEVGAVNPRYDEVLGVRCAPSLSELDFVPETVVVSVQRDRVLPALREAAELGSRAAVVFGIGFAETGPEGRARQRELQELAAASGMAVLGPNCQGLVNFAHPSALYIDTVRPYAPGGTGLIAQSGSVATHLINNRRGVRWRYAVSSGNEAVLDAADLLSHMVDDEACTAVCLFLESIRDPDAFFAACDRALERDLPIVALKTGTTPASARAAEAHSGALAAPDRLVDARFERHGVIRVATLEELLETANAFALRRRPTRGALATMTGSGGHIELVLDGCEGLGLEHPPLAPSTVAEVERWLPDFLDAKNPLDWWGVADEQRAYPALVEALAADPSVDVVLAVIDQTDEPTGEGRFQGSYDTALALAPRHPDTLFVLLEGVGGVSPPDRVHAAAEAGVLLVSGFGAGLRALGNLVAYARRRAQPRPAAAARDAAGGPLPATRSVSGSTALELVAAHGVPVVPSRRVHGAEEAVRAAQELGWPVVAKIGDERVTHKTEAGGVIVGIADAGALREAVQRLAAGGHDELLIQPQVRGVELILGITRHPSLGSFLVVGLGGIWTELLDEVAIVPAGLAEGDADRLLRRLRGHALLEGARGTAPVDREALVRLVEALDAMALALGDAAASVDLNPVIATPSGAWAVDALIVPAEPGGAG